MKTKPIDVDLMGEYKIDYAGNHSSNTEISDYVIDTHPATQAEEFGDLLGNVSNRKGFPKQITKAESNICPKDESTCFKGGLVVIIKTTLCATVKLFKENYQFILKVITQLYVLAEYILKC